jgi:DNA-binding transcriptional LysR family regulator
MDAAWLEDFLALIDCGAFSRAAEQRSITQPAFSRRIRARP